MSLLQQSPILNRIGLPQLRGLSVERRLVVWLTQQRLQTQKDALDVVHGGPLVLEDVETDAAGHVDVWVEHWGGEDDGWWLQWVGVGEGEGEFEGFIG